MLSVVIPACNETFYLPACLSALAEQIDGIGLAGSEIIVAANACTDDTVAVAKGFVARFAARGWRLIVIDLPEAGKPNALNRGDALASGSVRVYLDADVVCEPTMLAALAAALAVDEPRYATGRLIVSEPSSWFTRHYARIWTRLPFYRGGGTGAGLFAVNTAGRARWGEFPEIISDDTFVRWLFVPGERVEVAVGYRWPLVEGLGNLVRVRRRQDAGIGEIWRRYPELVCNEGKRPLTSRQMIHLAAGAPLSFLVYTGIVLAARFGGSGTVREWSRGR
jgi:glycosyltransferase involved in cell wall biosynthesis